jgi:hypothetical protein
MSILKGIQIQRTQTLCDVSLHLMYVEMLMLVQEKFALTDLLPANSLCPTMQVNSRIFHA